MHIRIARSGFSLIQVSIILTVAALILVSLLPGREAGDTNQKAVDTIHRMDKVEEAVKDFMAAYGRRPCPANGQYVINDQHFGIEPATPGTCTGGTPTAPLGPDGTGNVVGGTIPTKTLNLSDDYAFDGWGRRITYVVDKRATLHSTCLLLQAAAPHVGVGGIVIKDSSGGIRDYVMAAYISHGPDGHGAWPTQGGLVSGRLNSGVSDADTLTNASVHADFSVNFGNVFIRKEKTATFDDIVYYTNFIKNICCIGTTCS